MKTSSESSCTRICLWAGPRNISTALMYSFAQRTDTKVIDEPLYAHYLSKTEAKKYHPSSQEVINSMENDGEKVIASILEPQEKPILFIKHMTHHLYELDLSFLLQVRNVLLTRDPVDMLPSYAKEVSSPQMQDVGYAQHLELIQTLEAMGQEFTVLDSRNVLNDPQGVLEQLCKQIGIPFQKAMLNWEAGPRPEDGVWAKHWYESVHKSTSFLPYRPKTAPFPEALVPLLKECQPIYKKLSDLALQ